MTSVFCGSGAWARATEAKASSASARLKTKRITKGSKGYWDMPAIRRTRGRPVRRARMTPALWPFLGDDATARARSMSCPWRPCLQAPRHPGRDEVRDVAAHQRDLPHQRGRDVPHLGLAGRNTVSMSAPWRRSCPPSASRSRNRCRRAGRGRSATRPAALRGVDGEVGEGGDLDLGRRSSCAMPAVSAFSISIFSSVREQRRLARMHADADDQRVDQRAARAMTSVCPLVTGSNEPR